MVAAGSWVELRAPWWLPARGWSRGPPGGCRLVGGAAGPVVAAGSWVEPRATRWLPARGWAGPVVAAGSWVEPRATRWLPARGWSRRPRGGCRLVGGAAGHPVAAGSWVDMRVRILEYPGLLESLLDRLTDRLNGSDRVGDAAAIVCSLLGAEETNAYQAVKVQVRPAVGHVASPSDPEQPPDALGSVLASVRRMQRASAIRRLCEAAFCEGPKVCIWRRVLMITAAADGGES
ncbi:hypothetical protein CYMTET_33417 [Cymbomonas tetramitiformis]|uniref:Uncharacterized protein n=1 Tax=Cymbomonas tetramitiformis TaxID=36881 RepID=A0AAE0FD21_9CHLO|nr:hypothetical protein CYMTET_33417 [Cymbomonas tetramitiformis]